MSRNEYKGITRQEYGLKWRECNKEKLLAYRIKHRSKTNARNADYRQIRQALIVEAKNKPCMDCNIKYPSCVMDFDHRSGVNKEFTIAQTQVPISKLILEINKCDVVCSNCHRLRTAARRQQRIQS